MTEVTITDKLRNLYHDIERFSDWQPESDLDSLRNSCDVLGGKCQKLLCQVVLSESIKVPAVVIVME